MEWKCVEVTRNVKMPVVFGSGSWGHDEAVYLYMDGRTWSVRQHLGGKIVELAFCTSHDAGWAAYRLLSGTCGKPSQRATMTESEIVAWLPRSFRGRPNEEKKP